MHSRQSKIQQEQAAANSAVEEGKKVNKEERSFLQTALSQHRAEKTKEAQERQKKKHLEKRMKAILSLKDNITRSEVISWYHEVGMLTNYWTNCAGHYSGKAALEEGEKTETATE